MGPHVIAKRVARVAAPLSVPDRHYRKFCEKTRSVWRKKSQGGRKDLSFMATNGTQPLFSLAEVMASIEESQGAHIEANYSTTATTSTKRNGGMTFGAKKGTSATMAAMIDRLSKTSINKKSAMASATAAATPSSPKVHKRPPGPPKRRGRGKRRGRAGIN